MKSLIVLFCLLFCFTTSQGGEIPEKFRMYKVKVTMMDKSSPIKGILLQLKDSVILIGTTYVKKNYREGGFGIINVPVESIKKIKLRRLGKQGRAMGIGLGAGAVIGGIFGYSTGDWDSEPAGHPDSQAYFGAALFGLMGAGVGFFAGIPSKYFYVNGDLHLYTVNKEVLKEYAIVKD